MVYEEHSLVPFEPWNPVAERTLIIAPHPDDEVIGCGGLIASLAAAGRSVTTLVITDGAAGGDNTDGALASTRQSEVRSGLALLGAPDVRFLGIPDRAATSKTADITSAIYDVVRQLEPDLIAVPSLVEIHPDHAAIAEACVAALQRDPRLPALLPLTQIAFYEVSQPFAPNRLLDVTPWAGLKAQAIAKHETQTGHRPYGAYAEGLNRYRTMTLPPEATHAEAFWVTTLEVLATSSAADLATQMTPTRRQTTIASRPPVSVVIRTRNRPEWLGEAVASALASTHPVEVVVVNDGGTSPRSTLPAAVRLVDLDEQVGRSVAMNRGVEAATSPLICFLDDDDLIAEDHVQVLASAMRSANRAACYTDAVSVTLTRDDSGNWSEVRRERVYANDFDRDLLLIDNYIPLNTLIVRRTDYLAIGGFDPAFDLFEDWDFLLRLSARGDFERIPRVTCTIRHFDASGSLVQAAAADASRLAAGKAAIWKRHGITLAHESLALVLERFKRQNRELQDRFAQLNGERAHVARDLAQLERDKQTLIDTMGIEIRTRDAALEQERSRHDAVEAAAREMAEGLRNEMHEAISALSLQLEAVRAERDSRIAESHHLWGEIQRLNALLEQIYTSKTWKMHSAIERLKGRG